LFFLGHGPKFSNITHLWHRGILITLLTSLIPVPLAMYNIVTYNIIYYDFNILSLLLTIILSAMISIFITHIDTKSL